MKHSAVKRYHVATYHHFENGFDDKFEYSTIREAEKAARGYVSGKMEPDGFRYDGAAVYDLRTNRCVRVFGDYPDERAQAQALGLSVPEYADRNGTPIHAGSLIQLDGSLRVYEVFRTFDAYGEDLGIVVTNPAFLRHYPNADIEYSSLRNYAAQCVVVSQSF